MLKKKWLLPILPLVAAISLQAQSPMNDPFNDPFFQDPFGDDIFKEMIQMQRQMDEMFQRMQQRINQRSTRLVHPSMGMYKLTARSEFVDKGDHYELITNIPESKENQIDIRTQNGMLTISAKIVHEEQQKTNGLVSTSKSIQSFQQSTSLPTDANESNIKSEFKNGRLTITIGKKKTNAKRSTPAAVSPMSKPATETIKNPTLNDKNDTETVKIPTLNDKNDTETNLPKINKKLKKKSEPDTQKVGDKDSVS